MTKEHQEQLAELIDAQFDGTTDRASTRKLRDLLRDNPDARSWYVEYCQLHSMLAWEHGGLPPVEFGNIAAPSSRPDVVVPFTRSARRWRWLAIAASLLFLASAGMLVYELVGPPGLPAGKTALTASVPPVRERMATGVLRLTNHPVWDGSGVPAALGEPVFNSTLALKSGSVRIALFGGAAIDLEGPCQLDLLSDKRVFLRQGDILVSIQVDDTQLVIDTPVGELLHLGTEFGVSVAENGATEMYVFDGSVEVKQDAKGLPAGSARIFGVGAATRLTPSGRAEDLGRGPYQAFRQSHPRWPSDADLQPKPLSIEAGGYTVRYLKVDQVSLNSLAVADSILAGRVAADFDTIVAGVPCIDFQDHPATDGQEYLTVFAAEEPFPGDRNGRMVNDDHFLIQAKARFVVQDAWRYTFLVNVDDGARLRVDGKDVIVDDGIHPPQVSLGTVLLTPGQHTLELVAYDNGGFSRVELGYAVGATNKLEQFVLLGVAK